MLQEYVPFVEVPDEGTVAVQLRVGKKAGDWNEHVASVTPARSSVIVMLHATVADPAIVLMEVGLKLKPVRLGAVVSQSANAGAAAPAADRTRQHRTTTRRLMAHPPSSSGRPAMRRAVHVVIGRRPGPSHRMEM
jgi:hypothetical protein